MSESKCVRNIVLYNVLRQIKQIEKNTGDVEKSRRILFYKTGQE